MKKIKEKDGILKILIVINIVNFVIGCFETRFLNLKILLVILNLIVIFFADEKTLLAILFYLHPNSALYDDIGFRYIFNFGIFICLLKLLIVYKWKFNKKLLVIFLTIIMYDIVLMGINGQIDASILSMISWASSYLVLILYIEHQNKINKNKVYKYFAVGYALAFLCAIIYPITKYGINNIPTAYRFIGLLRDPNYYCVDALILIFSTDIYIEKKWLQFLLKCMFGIMGVLSISKTFIILLIVGCVIKICLDICRSKLKIKNMICTFFIVCGIIGVVFTTNNFDYIVEKYLYRTSTTSAFTGRDYIQEYYLNILINNPSRLIFGSSSKYNHLLGIGHEIGSEFFEDMVAHNTYLDIILAWGILGFLWYMFFIYNLQNSLKRQYNLNTNENKNSYYTLLILVCGFLFVLSYMFVDFFAIMLIYIFMSKYPKEKMINDNEVKDYV